MNTHHHHQQIQERAYALWVEEGRVDGRSDDYWFRAEREVNYAVETAPAEANENVAEVKKAPRRRMPRRRAA